MTAILAGIQKAPGPIPDLRPPKGEITTGFPETAFFLGALIFSLLVLIVGRIFHARRPLPAGPIHSPATIFRRQLAHIANTGGDPLERTIHAVRRYLRDAFELGSDGLTNEELAAEFAEHPAATEESLAALQQFLAGSDLVRFAPVAESPHGAVQQAAELVEQLEGRRRAALPPPLPAAS